MANIVEVNAALSRVKFVEHAEIANSQLIFRAAGQTLVGKCLQPHSHFVDFGLNGFTHP